MRRIAVFLRSVAVVASLSTLASCGSSSSTNVTAPTTAQCAVTLTSDALSMGASGGDGTVTVSINRECAWTAKSDVNWITLTTAATGQGGATVGFRVAPNTGTATRQGGIDVNDKRVDVMQSAAAACTYALSKAQDSIGAAGGTRTISVVAGPSCAWTASSNASWIVVSSGASGSGNGSVTITASPNTGLARSGTVIIAGIIYTLSQTAAGAPPPPECTFTLSATSQSIGASGGPLSVTVTTSSDCEWTATSQVGWITVTNGASGTGNGTVQLTVAANAGASPRSGTVAIAGAIFTVNQAAGGSTCSYGLSAASQSVGAAAGTGTVGVTTAAGCAWTATSNDSWLTITSGASGTGNGTVQFSFADNSDPAARTGTLTIAGQTFTINQAGTTSSCTFNVAPTTISVPADASTSSADVTTTASCAWTAASNVSWITLTGATSGSGNATVPFAIAANTDTSPRSGTLTIAGQTVTVNQAAATASCTFTVAPLTIPAAADASSTSVAVTTTSTCAWNATSNAAWITLTGSTSGTGNGTVDLGIAANPDPTPRSGTVTVAGQTVTVNQDAAAAPTCTFTLSKTSLAPKADASDQSIGVTASDSSCAWTASSDRLWMTITSGSTGTGNGTVNVHIDANPDTTARTGALTIAGQTVTVTQKGR
jgi:hypothetical protein